MSNEPILVFSSVNNFFGNRTRFSASLKLTWKNHIHLLKIIHSNKIQNVFPFQLSVDITFPYLPPQPMMSRVCCILPRLRPPPPLPQSHDP